MFCPDCGAEFREGYDRCADCGVGLVSEPPDEPRVEPWVTVMETSDVSAIPVLEMTLEAAGIPFRVKGEDMMNMFPSEALGALLHSSAGELLIRVPESRAEEARQLLATDAEVEGAAEIGDAGDDAGDDAGEPG